MSTMRRRYCPKCDAVGASVKDTPAHAIHFFMALVTFGFWLVPWLLFTLTKTYRCQNCGARSYGSKGEVVIRRVVMCGALAGAAVVAAVILGGH